MWILMCSIAIILCISFPINLGSGYILDLRATPLMLGGLYAGGMGAVVLAAVSIAYRALFGGIGSIVSIGITVIHLVAILILFKRFASANVKGKLLLSSMLGFMSAIVTIIIMQVMQPMEHVLLLTGLLIVLNVSGMLTMTHFIEILRDYSYLRREIIKSEKLEVVSQLAASISHEVRNPLTVGKGFLQLLHQGGVSPDKQKLYIKTALHELERAETIITDYLTFAKPTIEDNNVLIVRDELNALSQMIEAYALTNNIKIDLTCQEEGYILGNSQRLRQCLINVCKNACEAMEHGGDLSISSTCDTKQVTITIKDTGKGMSAKELARLGEPYYSTKGIKGTGLGMMVVFRIVEAMQGVIHIKSQQMQGTTVTISFPRVSGEYMNHTCIE
ncbi:two-component sensor histidine kinase [Bacillus sp. HMF5848]|nr:sensor histidine kinase [Bacillus sp. HMF5848]RSK29018.1 two-component sensor histidine kinase [Bacillus sp. HMF5848]